MGIKVVCVCSTIRTHPTRAGILFSVRIQFQILMQPLQRAPAQWKDSYTPLSMKSILLSLKFRVYFLSWFQGRFDSGRDNGCSATRDVSVVPRFDEITQKSIDEALNSFHSFFPLVILMMQDNIRIFPGSWRSWIQGEFLLCLVFLS